MNNFIITIISLSFFLSFEGICQISIHQKISFESSDSYQNNHLFRSSRQSHVLVQSDILPIPINNPTPFLAYSYTWECSQKEQTNFRIFIQFSINGEQWSTLKELKKDSHADYSPNKEYGALAFAEKEYRFYRFEYIIDNENIAYEKLDIHFINPGDTPDSVPTLAPELANRNDACLCDQPPILAREDWCPVDTCELHPDPQFTEVSHLIVHHSVNTNISDDWGAIVRSIWNHHVNINGWSDIGYNFLIDPNGVIYEGRGDNILGAHFCGTNTNTLGICMVGTFTTETPQTPAIEALVSILAWKSCNVDISPLGSSFHPASNFVLDHISGHRDGSCFTECPGNAFYPQLATVKDSVLAYRINNCGDELVQTANIHDHFSAQVMPNPTPDFFNINIKAVQTGTANLSITDISGKNVFEENYGINTTNWQKQINIQAFPKGAYFLKLKLNDYLQFFKIIKQ